MSRNALPSAAAFAGLAALSALGWSQSAAAQSSAPADAPPQASSKDDRTVPEVVVPDTYGAVATDIPPERQLTSPEIDTYGVSTIGDLVDALKPETLTSQGGGTALMINGHRVASPAAMMRIPIEAVLRAEIGSAHV